MVFCTLLFGLSIGAFDRFVPPGQPTNVESNTPLITGETLVSAVVPQHSTVVVIQKVIDDHIEEQNDGRQVETPVGLSDAEPHADQIVEAPKPEQTAELEQVVLESLEEIELIKRPNTLSVVLIAANNTLVEEDSPEPTPLQARAVELPRAAGVQNMTPTLQRGNSELPKSMNMQPSILIARAENSADGETPATTTPTINQADSNPVDPQLNSGLSHLSSSVS